MDKSLCVKYFGRSEFMTDLHVQENVISRGNFSCQIPNLILRPNIYQLIGENGAGKSVF